MRAGTPKIPIQILETDETLRAQVQLYVLRLDLTDAVVSGNKWFKLKYNLQQALDAGVRTVLSFGGAYSNHIHALAKAGSDLGLSTIGVIRGEAEYAANPTLSDAASWGMKLHFVDRSTYRRRHDPTYLDELKQRFSDPVIIPEGGSNGLAVKGAKEIITQEVIKAVKPDQIVLPCGTGGTLAGVALSVPSIKVLGVPVLKRAEFLYQDIQQLMWDSGSSPSENWELDLEGHGGGYAKVTPELLDFVVRMRDQHGLPLDQVYTAKMLLQLFKRLALGVYPKGCTILAIHTGGMQGARTLA